jgi:hypothetical protein
MSEADWRSSLASVMDRINHRANGPRLRYPLQHGTMMVGVYAPRGNDPQQPHVKDALYIIVSGTGEFVKNGERRGF